MNVTSSHLLPTLLRPATEDEFIRLRESPQRKLEEDLREEILAAWKRSGHFSIRRKNQPVKYQCIFNITIQYMIIVCLVMQENLENPF